jgi:pimeloyl-[acyl-carrier protein] synthase
MVETRDSDSQLSDPSFFQDPYPAYRQLREQDPVFWSQSWNAWIVTRFDDVMAIFKDPGHYSNAGRFSAFLAGLPETNGVGVEAVRSHYASGMLQSDPPTHTRLRPLVNAAFTPRRVEAMRPRISEIVDRLLDDAAERGAMDVIGDLAKPLPALVVSEMLGVPSADQNQMVAWSDAIAGFQATATAESERVEAGGRAIHGLESYFRDLLADRRRRPQDDLLSALAAAEADGTTLSEPELLSMCTTMYVAGHETTRNLIGNALVCLFREPSALRALQGEPERIPSAMEEVLRFESPIQRGWRRIGRDVTVRGRELREGQLVFMMLGAANRDPDQFDRPETFDIYRPPSRHVAFGMGIHFCLGAPLARIEGPVAVAALLRRMPRLAPADEAFDWNRSVHLRGVSALPVTF